MNIPFSPPDITDLEINNVIEVLKSGWITTGPMTKKFESKISEYCGTEKTVCLNSATAAMEMTLRALEIGKGDEIITTAYTYTASASVIHHTGAKIVMIDTEKDSYEMDYEKLEQAITAKTKAIIAVDLAGIICDYDKIFKIVERQKEKFVASGKLQKTFGRIIVMADGAHSFGANYKGEKSGSVADFTSFSFHAVKNITTAEGGAVTWKNNEAIDNEEIYKTILTLSLHGQTKDALAKTKPGAWEYDVVSPAYKCNMTDIMAAIGLAQLERYEEMIIRRKEIIEKYDEAFSNTELYHILNHYTDESDSSGHLYLLRLVGKTEKYRNDLITRLAEKGISTNVHYKPLPMLTAYKNLGFNIKDYPNAFDMYKNEISLPLNTLISEDQIDYLLNEIKMCEEVLCV